VPDNGREIRANVPSADRVSPLASAPEQEPLCLTDFEPLAKAKMSAMGWDYVTACDGIRKPTSGFASKPAFS
jgi:hypothetical protein